ncbi:3-isopropylmalate dehydratase small subunit [Vampirovibrio chlorellavorus]|uniref:3-isopropylmalate dehydratase small subunit n=1 Tax=Vampirovibrio chlorellavorus TaxID=758823 RepID=UPI0026EDBF8A|nr:3-isopropylmalate dehydratase small subunit [Vampirovibrio chlorellavorus]
MSKQLTRIESTCVPLNQNNVDTDQVIPARFLKGTTKVGLGEKLFYDLRYLSNGQPNPDFVLNNPKFGGQILVAAHNFGCGSSREHAPWALKDYGFQAILAVSFADIFRNNSLKNQLLAIALPEPVILSLLAAVEANPALAVSIDLPRQVVAIPGQPDQPFEIDPYRKQCLMEGLDDIGYALSHLSWIEQFEAAHA